MGEAKNIAGEWGVDKSHGGEQKIRGGGLSRGVLLRGVSTVRPKLKRCTKPLQTKRLCIGPTTKNIKL